MANKKMKKCVKKALSGLFAFLFVLSFVCYQNSDLKELEQISVYSFSDGKMVVKSDVNYDFLKADVGEDTAVLKLFGVIPVKKVTVNKISTDNICLGGNAFGIKLFTKGVIVVGLTDIVTSSGAVCPASDAGVKKGDIILSVNGEKVDSAEDFGAKLAKCGKKGAVLRIMRDEKEFDATVTPVISAEDNNYKVGLWVRDSTAGIGTVTFIDKKTGVFGGLGHGVCDVDTGLLMPLNSGTVIDVEVTGVVKGEPQNPGELQGNFSRKTVGKLDINTETGVFGRLANTDNLGEVVPIGTKETVGEGKIYIYTTISGTTPQKYEAEIIKIYNESGKTKNFMIKVTDERLLEETGGIVQGMSGSPILQNGKLIGAVTHVMINSPEKGYGIFIENMLSSANSILSEQNKAA
ncbi:MAG: SpoIVB peptidase [Ruminococcaceae bacterium]|nr:SpoIVB peptidase [Oscillospiraceae bacterium]